MRATSNTGFLRLTPDNFTLHKYIYISLRNPVLDVVRILRGEKAIFEGAYTGPL